MPLPRLVPGADQVAVQETWFTTDAVGRFVANTCDEATSSGPFSAVVVGAGAYGAYCAVRIRRAHPTRSGPGPRRRQLPRRGTRAEPR